MIRAVVTPEGGAVFAVTNYESAAIVKARELHRNAIKGRSTEGELDTWSPAVISFNTPEQLVLNFERSGDQEDAWLSDTLHLHEMRHEVFRV